MKSSLRRTSAARVALLVGLALAALVASADPAHSTSDEIAVVAGGEAFTCALSEAGTVQCWGSNEFGQLGDGGVCGDICGGPVFVCATGATAPCSPANGNVLAGVTLMAIGFDHACVLTSSAALACWGSNDFDKLGAETTQSCGSPSPTACALIPADVASVGGDVAAVSAGQFHTCVLLADGTVQCWGLNENGQLGDGTTARSAVPVDVVGISNAVDIAAGGLHTCVITAAGGVSCWGRNVEGQIGDGRACGMICPSPSPVDGLASGVSDVSSAGLHACALTGAGAVQCWGFNFDGQVGDGTDNNIRISPAAVSGLGGDVIAITANGGFRGHSCAIDNTGRVMCWGDNAKGQLGDGTTTDRLVPVDLAGVSEPVIAIAAGDAHTCAMTAPTDLRCWGNNSSGQLGDGTTVERHLPVSSAGLTPATGDANCDDGVDSVDAALLLQRDAGLTGVLACEKNADIDGDGLLTSLDAALILQLVAGLIPFFG